MQQVLVQPSKHLLLLVWATFAPAGSQFMDSNFISIFAII